MTPDDYTTAARAEAQRAYQDTGMPRYDLAVHMAEWARVYLTQQEPTDAEVDAALTAILISEAIALGQTASEAADYAIRELESRDLANLRTGVRCALRAARDVRAGA